MFSRIVERLANKYWSITARLTLLYTLSAFGLLLLAAGFFYSILVSDLREEEHQFLVDKVQVLRAILQERPGQMEPLEEEVQWEGNARRFSKYYSRVLDPEGHLLIETSGMGEIVSAAKFPVPVAPQETPEEVERFESRGKGITYLLTSAVANVGSSGEQQSILQIALDITDEKNLLANYQHKLMMVLALGILLSGTAGTMITRKGMSPLKEIVQTAKRITASQLHERISLTRWPKELVALADTFDEMLKRLEDSFKRLHQFSGDLAHELRTPINNLSGEAEVALSRARTTDEYREVLESSLEEYSRLSRMIESLLFLARAEVTEIRIEKSLIDARQEIEAVREYHDAIAEEQKVAVTCRGNASLYADPLLFRRAVSNLISNALQYTPSKGKIDLLVRSPVHEYVEVDICDTGFGIDARDLPKIFDRFYRGDRSKPQGWPQDRQGMGLGLAIVKSIMDLHGGRVTVESELNKGTKVTLAFPLSTPTS